MWDRCVELAPFAEGSSTRVSFWRRTEVVKVRVAVMGSREVRRVRVRGNMIVVL